jgi:condensation domain-containing protein
MDSSVFTVEARGARGVAAPATWSQVFVWNEIHDNPARFQAGEYNLAKIISLPPPGIDHRLAVKAVAKFVESHESMRTSFIQRNDRLYQVISRDGLIDMVAAESSLESLDQDASLLRARLRKTNFNYQDRSPFKIGFINVADRTYRIVVTVCHLLADDIGMEIVASELNALLRGADGRKDASMQPVEIAIRQNQEFSVKQSERAIAYWCEQYSKLRDRLPRIYTSAEWNNRAQGNLVSPALNRASEVLADRTGTSVSTVLMAATSALLATWFNRDIWGIRLIVHNRFRALYRETVGSMAQRGLLVVELDDSVSLEEFTREVWKRELIALQYASYDYRRLRLSLAEVLKEGMGDTDVSCCFNDLGAFRNRSSSRENATLKEVAELRKRTSVTSVNSPIPERCNFCLVTLPARANSGNPPIFSLMANLNYLMGLTVEGFLWRMEDLITESVGHDITIGDVRNKWKWFRERG